MRSLGYFEIICYWRDKIEIKLGLGLRLWCRLRYSLMSLGYFEITATVEIT